MMKSIKKYMSGGIAAVLLLTALPPQTATAASPNESIAGEREIGSSVNSDALIEDALEDTVRAGAYNTSYKEIKVYEDGILTTSTRIYYKGSDEHDEGVLRSQDGQLRFYVDGEFRSDFSGRLSTTDMSTSEDYMDASFYVKDGIVDTTFNDIVTIYNTDLSEGLHFYVVNGIISSNTFSFALENDPDAICNNATGLSIENSISGISVKYDRYTYGYTPRGFRIYRMCHDTGEFVYFADLDGDSTGFLDKAVEKGYTYTYYIWTYCDDRYGYGSICGFVDLTIVFGGSSPGKTDSFKTYTVPDDAAGDTFSYGLSADGVLTVSGKGPMPDLQGTDIPWEDQRTSIQQIVIEEGVTSISERAFYGCTDLTSAIVPSSVEIIDKAAFGNCPSLETVTFGTDPKLRMIQDYAFQNAKKLTRIQLPPSLRNISSKAFNDSGLQAYELEDNPLFTVKEGVLFNKNEKTLISYPCARQSDRYTIPMGTEVIENSAFLFAQIQDITIPDSVTKIKDSAFSYSKLRSVQIPDPVTTVGKFVFSYCQDLKELYIGNGLSALPYCFADNCLFLETLSLGNGLEELGNRCFFNCTSLQEITIPGNIRTIQTSFLNCHNLKTVHLGEGIERIGSSAFANTSISEVTLPVSLAYLERSSFPGGCKLTFPEGSKLAETENGYVALAHAGVEVEYHYDHAFQVLEEVNRQREAKGLNTLKMDADLIQAAMLRAAEISVYFDHTRPSGQSCFTVDDKASGENIAMGSQTASKVMENWMGSPGHSGNILDKDFQGIGVGCVEAAGTWWWVQLFSETGASPEADSDDYQDHTEVKKIAFAKDGDAAKKLSAQVKNSAIHVGGTTDAYLSFSGPYHQVKIHPDTVGFSSSNENICKVSDSGRVTGCAEGKATITARLKDDPDVARTVDVIVRASGQPTGPPNDERPVDGETSGNIKIGTVFTSGGYQYKIAGKTEAVFWRLKDRKKTKVTIPATITYKGRKYKIVAIADKALYKTRVQSVSMGANIKTIGTSALSGCSRLNKVTMGSNVKKIEKQAFKNCTALKEVTIPSKVTSIGTGAFLGCKKLAVITIRSAKLGSVGKNALKGIRSTAKIKVPSKKLKAYQRLLKGKGQGKKVKVIVR